LIFSQQFFFVYFSRAYSSVKVLEDANILLQGQPLVAEAHMSRTSHQLFT
jgi:hypothetical protein